MPRTKKSKPKHKTVFDPTFKYYHSTDTNIARTFARVRKKMNKPQTTVAASPVACAVPTPLRRKA